MNKKTATQMVVTGILIVILIFSWTSTMRKVKMKKAGGKKVETPKISASPEKAEEPPAVEIDTEPKPAVKRGSISEETSQMQLARLSLSWGRDPFILSDEKVKRKGQEETSPEGLSLKGISQKGQERFAIVNDFIVKVGDTIQGYHVVEIVEKGIVLEKDGSKYTIGLGEE